MSRATFLIVHIGSKPIGRILNDCLEQLSISQNPANTAIYLYVTHPDSALCDVSRDKLANITILTPSPFLGSGGAGGVPLSDIHARFLETQGFKYDDYPGGGYWTYCSERFLAIYDVMLALQLTNVLHIETDILVYQDAAPLLEKIRSLNIEVGLTVMGKDHVTPGVVYYRDAEAARMIAEHVAEKSKEAINDTISLGMLLFNPSYADIAARITPLPVIPASSVPDPVADPDRMYSRHQSELGVIFDATALGQWIGGMDIVCGQPQYYGNPYVNQIAPFQFNNPHFQITWDSRRRLYVNGVPVFNLHVHSKQLARWKSVA